MLETVIVGAGMAGLEVARHLTSGSVLVMDAARSSIPSLVTERQWCTPTTDNDTWWPHERSDHPVHFSTNFGLRTRFGGRSLCWHGVSLGMPDYAFDDRWPETAVAWVTDPAQPFQRHLRSLSEALVIEAPTSLEGYRPVPKMTSTHPTPCRDDAVYTPVDHVRELRGEIQLSAIVRSIDRVGAGFRIEADVSGARRTVKARNVVVAAGALHNGGFALDFLQRDRPPRIYDHIVVGRSLVSTHAQPTTNEGLFYREIGNSKTRFFLDLRNTARGLEIDCWTMAADDASYLAEVVGPPDRPSVRFTDRGLARRTATVQALVDRELAEVIETLGIKNQVCDDWSASLPTHEALLEFRAPTFETDRAICFVSALGSTDHDHGTVPFGLVDQWGELLGVPGLRFVGPSSFPTLGGANPSLSTLAQARVVADALNAS